MESLLFRGGRSQANHVLQRYGKTGKLVKKYYSVYDNTGHHSYTGKSVHIFLNKEDAVAEMKKQFKKIDDYLKFEISSIEKERKKIQQILDEE